MRTAESLSEISVMMDMEISSPSMPQDHSSFSIMISGSSHELELSSIMIQLFRFHMESLSSIYSIWIMITRMISSTSLIPENSVSSMGLLKQESSLAIFSILDSEYRFLLILIKQDEPSPLEISRNFPVLMLQRQLQERMIPS